MNREKIIEVFDKIKDPSKENRNLLLFSSILTFILLTFILFNNFIFTSVYVIGPSMEPNIQTGDVLYVNMVKKPKYGDVIIVNAIDGESPFIKRVIGLEGDTIWCSNGKVYRQHKNLAPIELNEPYLNTLSKNFGKITVQENKIFFLGDNRLISCDSSDPRVGTRSIDDVIGVVPNWALRHRKALTKFSNLFNFTGNININKEG